MRSCSSASLRGGEVVLGDKLDGVAADLEQQLQARRDSVGRPAGAPGEDVADLVHRQGGGAHRELPDRRACELAVGLTVHG